MILKDKSINDLNKSKTKLNGLKSELDNLINEMEIFIDKGKQISKETLTNLKSLINQITLAQENYASFYGKNESTKSDSIKRKERIKNIDIELDNWKNLRSNSEKMKIELNERMKKSKIQFEIEVKIKKILKRSLLQRRVQMIFKILENAKRRSMKKLNSELTRD